MILSDKPIEKPESDILARCQFAKSVAHALMAWNGEDSIVIALNGKWGSGKTSLLNLILVYLEQESSSAAETAPLIVRFNPWYFTNQDQLLLQFFETLADKFNTREVLERSGTLARITRKNLRRFGRLLTTPVAIAALSTLASAITQAQWIASFVPAIPSTISALSVADVAETAAEATKQIDDADDPLSILELKLRIDEAFKALDKHMIIMIDDLDRLSKDEIRLVFRLIKLNANFPNTVYVVAADREVVVDALNGDYGSSGEAFLEKIVQVSFDVPAIDRYAIEELLQSQLDQILSQPGLVWESAQREKLYSNELWQLFTSLRAVKRFLNSLAVTLNMVSNEVNAVDFIGIEVIRVFAPNMYAALPANKDLLVNISTARGAHWLESLFPQRQDKEQLKSRCEAFSDLAPIGIREQMYQILTSLFPIFEIISQGTNSPSYDYSGWRRNRRVCAPDFFDVYFLMGIPHGRVSQSDVSSLIKLLNAAEQEAIRHTLARFVTDDRLFALLQAIEDHLSELSSTGLISFASTLVWLDGSGVEDNQRALLNNHMLLLLKLANVFHAIPRAERLKWLALELQKTTDPTLLVALVASEQSDDGRMNWEDTSQKDIDEERSLCLARIHNLASDDALLQVRDLAEVLTRWAKWSPDDSAFTSFVERKLSTPSEFLEFIDAFGHLQALNPESSQFDAIRVRRIIREMQSLLGTSRASIAMEMLHSVDPTTLSLENRSILEKVLRAGQSSDAT